MDKREIKKAIIIGATSGIARSVSIELANRNYELILVARDYEELQRISADLKIRNLNLNKIYVLNILEHASIKPTIKKILNENEDIDEMYFFIGYLGDQQLAQNDWQERERILDINYKMPVHILSIFASYFEKQKKGKMIIIGSVAGDRGRQSNYFYGSAKAGLHIFAQGLRNRLNKNNVHVMTVKLGFIDTAMTFGLSGLFFVASPQKAAMRILKAASKNKDVVYIPFFWKYIMLIIKSIPETIFKKLSL